MLDYSTENASQHKSPRMRALLHHIRPCPCAVVRKGQKIALYSEAARPGLLREWLEKLKMGEVKWTPLESAD